LTMGFVAPARPRKADGTANLGVSRTPLQASFAPSRAAESLNARLARSLVVPPRSDAPAAPTSLSASHSDGRANLPVSLALPNPWTPARHEPSSSSPSHHAPVGIPLQRQVPRRAHCDFRPRHTRPNRKQKSPRTISPGAFIQTRAGRLLTAPDPRRTLGSLRPLG
jgi:hypothetical protein